MVQPEFAPSTFIARYRNAVPFLDFPRRRSQSDDGEVTPHGQQLLLRTQGG
jgi:hypothetical protein